MKLTGSAACNYIDLTSRAPSVLWQVIRPQNIELRDRINTWIGEQGQVGATIHVVGPVNTPIILRRAVPVDREIYLIGSANRVADANKKLIRRQIG